MKPHLVAGANTLSFNHSHHTCIQKQMSYVFRCFEMVGFQHNDFVEIGRIQADSKLQVSKPVLTLNKHKAVYPWGGFNSWF